MAFEGSLPQKIWSEALQRVRRRPLVIMFDTEDRRATQLPAKLQHIGYRVERLLTPIGHTASMQEVLNEQRPDIVFIDRFLYASQGQREAFIASAKQYAPKAMLVVQSRREPSDEERGDARKQGYFLVGPSDPAVVSTLVEHRNIPGAGRKR